jgi:hypothetical protein
VPTAVQSVASAQDTPYKEEPSGNDDVSARVHTGVLLVPLRAYSRGTLFPPESYAKPAAVHVVVAEQDTASNWSDEPPAVPRLVVVLAVHAPAE